MSYQVLARKWRPRIFREMVGQEHVLQALINALDHKRLHHAYLFTGTRGVGKTTIARILAKCLNCEIGVSSEPCGKCSSCTEIAEGRFVDLIEVDAASRTKVEDTRELLDNVQYAPTRGRYKIYLIDEVHMLSNHSFNALLKTLEEPPEHVKFLLATTDPQKLPVTILSRCLQFNLKNMSPERIVSHLQHVLKQELIPFDDASLWLLARAADGSMRDALSLTDQAISFGNGKLAEDDIVSMLGAIDQRLIHELVEALIELNAEKILAGVARFAEHAPDYRAALADILSVFHRIAIAQALPDAVDNSFGDRESILNYARQLASEDVQLFYQTALIGRRDLPLASDPRSGFEMTLLRMLAFKPQGVADVPTKKLEGVSSLESQNTSSPVADASNSEVLESKENDVNQAGVIKPQFVIDDYADSLPESEAVHPSELPEDSVKKPQGPSLHEGNANQISETVELNKHSKPSHDTASSIREQLQEQVKSIESQRFDTNTPVSKKSAEQANTSDGVFTEPDAHVRKESNNAELRDTGLKDTGLKDTELETKTHMATEPKVSLAELSAKNWVNVYRQLPIKGIILSTASNCVLTGIGHSDVSFVLDQTKASLFDDAQSVRLADALTDYFGTKIRVSIELGDIPEGMETPAAIAQREYAERYDQALLSLRDDPIVQTLQQQFGAELDEQSIKIR